MPLVPAPLRVGHATRQHSAPALFHRRFLLVIAGLGGLLYGIDIGIISAALLYLGKTVDLTVAQTSAIVAAVLGGSMVSSLIAGFLADLAGRRKMMIASGLLFVCSVLLIVLSHGFLSLFLGRLMQGISGGVIAVVVPLYLAETLPAHSRGQGSATFQFMLTFGIVMAAVIGWYFIRDAELAIAAAHGNAMLIECAQNHAWRGMFLSVIYPGLLFSAGTFALSETPRWLFRKGRSAEALASLLRTSTADEAHREFANMQRFAAEGPEDTAAAGPLLQRKYILPFVLACVVLACNQATGINSILGYLSLILKQAGMTATRAAQGDLAVKLLNCIVSLVAVSLIDRKGRKFLLTLGSAGVFLALSLTAFFFHREEVRRHDIPAELQARVSDDRLSLNAGALRALNPGETAPLSLTVVYSFGDGEKIATLATSDAETLNLAPETAGQRLLIRHAYLAPQPTQREGWAITLCLALFIASFSIGPGVVVWLILSELMPTRIRSNGMGIALLINQGVSTLIAGAFLPTVTDHGYATMFAIWATCTVVYFITAAFFLPETKGKTLEEIEQAF
ncbi:Sugar transporter [Granulicella rosea]|uniref:Sugar transporter n=1 Tax=Granulicella rosea TaxID=474952 RepID=A0A239MIU6_9BACT|nr:MFS transporter [Granulicella rosea]SNT41888.1 Sugar transporter [Granulicella rosea]